LATECGRRRPQDGCRPAEAGHGHHAGRRHRNVGLCRGNELVLGCDDLIPLGEGTLEAEAGAGVGADRLDFLGLLDS
jgi:hypothetical protein